MRCARERGVRLTPLRRRVLELVWGSHRAVKAYDLLAALGDAVGAAKPPTVYRALEFLMAQGLVHRIDSLNAFVGCPQPDHRHSAQFLICGGCGDVFGAECGEYRLCRRRPGGRNRLCALTLDYRASRQMSALHDASADPLTRPPPGVAAEASLASAHDLVVRYGGRTVLDRVLDRGSSPRGVVSLIGPNGAGKTTAVRALLGLIKPDAGVVRHAPSVVVGYVPQRIEPQELLPLTHAASSRWRGSGPAPISSRCWTRWGRHP